MAKRSSFVGTGTGVSHSDGFPTNFFFRSSPRRVRDGACDRAMTLFAVDKGGGAIDATEAGIAAGIAFVKGRDNEVVDATGDFSGTVLGTVLGTGDSLGTGDFLGTGVGVGAIGREGMVLGG